MSWIKPPREVELLGVEEEVLKAYQDREEKLDKLDEEAYIPEQSVFRGKEVAVWRRARQASAR